MKTYTCWTDAEMLLLSDTSKTLSEIREDMPYRTMRSLRAKCHKLGIRRDEQGKSHRRLDWSRSFMTDWMCQFLDGFILGDGCIVGPNGTNRKQSYLKFGQQYKECRDYFVSAFLEYKPVCSKVFVPGGPKCRDKRHVQFIAHTKTHPDLTVQYNRWYCGGKKIIPCDLVLTPLVVLNWYIGDGSNYGSVRFHSQGFKANEIDSILLPQMLNLGFEPRRDKVNDIRLTRVGSQKMLSYIDCVATQCKAKLRCYSYKFEVSNA